MIQSAGKSTKQTRYRAYFWLMNASSVAVLFALGQPKELPPLLAWPAIEVTMGTAVYLAWTAYMILFVFTFQVLRWRDSR